MAGNFPALDGPGACVQPKGDDTYAFTIWSAISINIQLLFHYQFK